MATNAEKINSINDLYIRVLPALETKVNELKREKLNDITVKDIWNYCIENKWIHKKDLRMYELVDDILNLDSYKIQIYVKKNRK